MSGGEADRAVLVSALVLEREGLDFYSKMSTVAADPRARQFFLEMADQKRRDMHILHERFTQVLGDEHVPTTEEAERLLQERGTPVPPIYPRKSMDTAVCFVCGEEVPVEEIPDECPGCGASRYAFERDIDEDAAVKMARENEVRRLEFYRRSLERISEQVRAVLEDLLRRTEEQLEHLGKD